MAVDKEQVKMSAATTETNGTPTKKEPSAHEAMFFFAIVKHTRNKADIDWESVAKDQGFKSADVARVRFGQIKRKLGLSSVTDTPPRGSATKKRTGGPSATTTPTKGPKNDTPVKAVKSEPLDDETPVKEEGKKKSTPRKTAKSGMTSDKVAKTTGRVGVKGARAGSKSVKGESLEGLGGLGGVDAMDVNGVPVKKEPAFFDDDFGSAEAYEPPSQFEEEMKIKDLYRDEDDDAI
ncbi:hypothetical protein CP532_4828 [Ophiocordyceps camponoti-leonardi (nom. inval.)]|nr:hypothetical protein CP532_4828 [Ophiocordyceps camponoti-leonardi (nom. inval.)]